MAIAFNITTTTKAAPPADYRDTIAAARVALPRPDVSAAPVRRFVSVACTAEAEHARIDFWRIANTSGDAIRFDRFRDPDCHTAFALPHERAAAIALNWLSHLQAHDADRHGKWSSWSSMTRNEKCAWARRRRYLVHGLIRAAAAYTAARNAI